MIYDMQSALVTHEPSDDIVIIAIDEASLFKLGRWPWSRRVHAQLIDKLTQHKVKGIIFDIIFSEKNLADVEGDAMLSVALRENGKVVLPVLLEQSRLRGQLVETLPLPELLQQSIVGHVHVELDPDGIARSSYLYAGLGEPRWSHISLAAMKMDKAVDKTAYARTKTTVQDANSDPSWTWVREHHFLIPFVGPPGSFKTISYLNVLNDQVLPGSLEGKLVIVGVTASGLSDSLPTPVSGRAQPMSGIEINANILQALQNNSIIHQISDSWLYLISTIFILITVFLFPYFSPRNALLFLLAMTLLLLALTLTLLHGFHLWVPISAILICLFLSYPLWAWRRLEYTVKFLNMEIEQLSLETKEVEDKGAELNRDSLSFLNVLMPIEGLAIYNKNKKNIHCVGKISTDIFAVNIVDTWRNVSDSDFCIRFIFKTDIFYLCLHLSDDIDPPNERRTQLLKDFTEFQVSTEVVTAKSTVEVLESRIQQVQAATSKLAGLQRFIAGSFEQMADGVIVVNSAGIITLINQQAEEYISGHQNHNLLRKSIFNVLEEFALSSVADWKGMIRQVLLELKSQQAQAYINSRDFIVYISPLVVIEEKVTGFIITLSDVSELKNAERKRNDTLGFLSHDLRSPLVSILSIVDKKNIENNYVDPTILNAIENYANRSIQLAEDFIHLSRIESDELIELSDLDLSDIVANAIAEVWCQARIKNITIMEKLDRDNWLSVNGSVIERVLVNLLSNSIKYSPDKTTITITSSQKNDGLQCCVEDNGFGIPESDLETVFKRFHRAKHQGNIQPKGLGLGLAFVHAAIKRHNGTLSVKSVVGKGSIFCFFIPFNKTER